MSDPLDIYRQNTPKSTKSQAGLRKQAPVQFGVADDQDTKKRREPRADIVCLANVKPEVVLWTWTGRIPSGRISLLVGRPGAGKSLLTCDIAARLSRGMLWPAGTGIARQGETLFICAEDDPADTVVPRLNAAGADRSKIHYFRAVTWIEDDGREKSVAFDLRNIEMINNALVALPNVRLVVIDPVGNYLGGQVDSHRDNEVRSVLMPLSTIAKERDAAILLVCHTRKAMAAYADDMALGSRAFVGVARSVLHLGEDPDDRARKLLLPGKCNLSIPAPGLAFRIAVGDEPRLEWETDPLEGLHADDALAAGIERHSTRGPAPDRRDAAVDWLSALLRNGHVPVNEIKQNAKAAGLAWRTVQRASGELKVVHEKQGFSGGWTWRMPPSQVDQHFPRRPSNEKPGDLREIAAENDELSQRQSEDGQVHDNLDTFRGNGSATEPLRDPWGFEWPGGSTPTVPPR